MIKITKAYIADPTVDTTVFEFKDTLSASKYELSIGKNNWDIWKFNTNEPAEYSYNIPDVLDDVLSELISDPLGYLDIFKIIDESDVGFEQLKHTYEQTYLK